MMSEPTMDTTAGEPRRSGLSADVVELSAHTFSAAEVAEATQQSLETLTSLLFRHTPLLCSAAGGRGRAREFFLIDVYIIALIHELSQTEEIKRAVQAAAWLSFSELCYEDMVTELRRRHSDSLNRPGPPKRRKPLLELQRAREDLGRRIENAPEFFWQRGRKVADNWTIVLDRTWDVSKSDIDARACRSDQIGAQISDLRRWCGFNATSLLRHVDGRLTKIVRGRTE